MPDFFYQCKNELQSYERRIQLGKMLFVAASDGVVPGERDSLVSCIVNGVRKSKGLPECYPYFKSQTYIGEKEYVDVLWEGFLEAVPDNVARENKVLNSLGFLIKPKIYHVMRDRGTDMEIDRLVEGIVPIWPRFSGERISRIPQAEMSRHVSLLNNLEKKDRAEVRTIAFHMDPFVAADVKLLRQGYRYIDIHADS